MDPGAASARWRTVTMSDTGKNDDNWVPMNISVLEADLAFFEAKLAMLEGEPGSHYKDAQRRVYRELSLALQGHLIRLRGKAKRGIPPVSQGIAGKA